jgi:hypothetical protein
VYQVSIYTVPDAAQTKFALNREDKAGRKIETISVENNTAVKQQLKG